MSVNSDLGPRRRTRRVELGTSNALSDDQVLIRLGKKPVLKRSFGFVSVLGFSCTVLITWEGTLIVSTEALLNGGPAGVIWGFLIVWIGTSSTFAVIGELASMAPTAGGQYFWISILAPLSARKFLSYITAWITVCGWQAVTASAGYLIGTLIEGLFILNHPSFVPKPWQSMMFFWAVIWVSVFINSVTSKALARFEGIILILHLAGFFAVIIPLVYLGPHGDGKVFTTFLNEGNWRTKALSFFVGLPASVFSLLGADSVVHMSEEIRNAQIIVPQALMLSLLINGVLGFAMVIALMFCLGDIQAALDAQQTLGYSFLEIFLQAVDSRVGVTVMTVIIVVMGVCSTVGCFAASSRMLWSFSRDRGVPYSKTLLKLDPRTSIPIYTIGVTTVISMILSLIVLGSSVDFNNIVSLSVIGLYSSYLLSCSLLLWRRAIGSIKPADSTAFRVGPGEIHWGPWHIPEPLGTINNAFACIYLIVLLFWSFWPPQTPVSPSTMNFSVLVFGATVLFSTVWYLVKGKSGFLGPVEEFELSSTSN